MKASPFSCPKTGAILYHGKGDVLMTEHGEVEYPVIEGVPLLIENHVEHMTEIELIKKTGKGDWYDKSQQEYASKGPYRHHLARRKKIVQEKVSQFLGQYKENNNELSFLDFGCGDGVTSAWIKEQLDLSRSKLFLTDYNMTRLLRAKGFLGDHPSLNYFMSDTVKCPLAEASMDFIFSNHVIEHVPNDLAYLKRAHRLLKEDGMLLLGCPNEGVFFWMLAYALSPSSIRTSDHLHFYNEKSLSDLADSAGFRLLESKNLGYGFPHWRIDGMLRQFKWMDDMFHHVGQVFFRGQGSALYLTLMKK